MNATTELLPGFDDPVHQCQATFQALLQALARPGRLYPIPAPACVVPGLGAGSAAIALTLVDFETSVWLDENCCQAADYLRFHCGCVIVNDPREAQFAFASGLASLPAFDRFRLGTDEEPEDSTTLIVELENLSTDGPWVLTGPGIEHEHRLCISGLEALWVQERAALATLFPIGLDLLLSSHQQVAGISRTTQIHHFTAHAG
jgi:alpha-D-ribose 1-methylphosphonate 5-triphosphate synthase subunit PhnH